jgi:hypothetical protein
MTGTKFGCAARLLDLHLDRTGRSIMNYSHETAPTQFIEANGVRFAYRRLGVTNGMSCQNLRTAQ